MSNLPARRPSGLRAALQGRPAAKQVAAIQEQAFIERAQDAAERDLALLKLCDTEALALQGMTSAGNISDRLVAEVEANPFAAKAVGRIADTGVRGLDRTLRRFIEES